MAIGGRAGESFTEINVTPLTDVFLVLLVIMILIAPLVNQSVLKVAPPGTSPNTKSTPDKGPKIDVEVQASGVVKVNQQTLSQPDTTAIANAIKTEQQKAGKEDLPLNLSADGDSLQKYNVAVMDAAAGCNIKELHVMPLRK